MNNYETYEEEDTLEPWERQMVARNNARAYEEETGLPDTSVSVQEVQVVEPVSTTVEPKPQPAKREVVDTDALIAPPVKKPAKAQWMTPPQVAAELGVDRKTVMRLLDKHGIPYQTLGRNYRIHMDAVIDLCDAIGHVI